jgi:hypothetical protein
MDHFFQFPTEQEAIDYYYGSEDPDSNPDRYAYLTKTRTPEQLDLLRAHLRSFIQHKCIGTVVNKEFKRQYVLKDLASSAVDISQLNSVKDVKKLPLLWEFQKTRQFLTAQLGANRSSALVAFAIGPEGAIYKRINHCGNLGDKDDYNKPKPGEKDKFIGLEDSRRTVKFAPFPTEPGLSENDRALYQRGLAWHSIGDLLVLQMCLRLNFPAKEKHPVVVKRTYKTLADENADFKADLAKLSNEELVFKYRDALLDTFHKLRYNPMYNFGKVEDEGEEDADADNKAKDDDDDDDRIDLDGVDDEDKEDPDDPKNFLPQNACIRVTRKLVGKYQNGAGYFNRNYQLWIKQKDQGVALFIPNGRQQQNDLLGGKRNIISVELIGPTIWIGFKPMSKGRKARRWNCDAYHQVFKSYLWASLPGDNKDAEVKDSSVDDYDEKQLYPDSPTTAAADTDRTETPAPAANFPYAYFAEEDDDDVPALATTPPPPSSSSSSSSSAAVLAPTDFKQALANDPVLNFPKEDEPPVGSKRKAKDGGATKKSKRQKAAEAGWTLPTDVEDE